MPTIVVGDAQVRACQAAMVLVRQHAQPAAAAHVRQIVQVIVQGGAPVPAVHPVQRIVRITAVVGVRGLVQGLVLRIVPTIVVGDAQVHVMRAVPAHVQQHV